MQLLASNLVPGALQGHCFVQISLSGGFQKLEATGDLHLPSRFQLLHGNSKSRVVVTVANTKSIGPPCWPEKALAMLARIFNRVGGGNFSTGSFQWKITQSEFRPPFLFEIKPGWLR
jgi:hypothetical protein